MSSSPGSLTSLTHLNAFSADVAHAMHTQGAPPPWPNTNFPQYASARRQNAAARGDVPRATKAAPAALLIRDRDGAARRAARQAAARKLREMRAKEITSSEEGDGSSVSSLTSETEGSLRGVLRKRGGKTKMLMRRWFVLEDAVLYNYRSAAELIEGKESWKLSMPGAAVGFDPKTLRIVVALDGFRTLVLYAESVEQARVWHVALTRAADSVSRGCLCDLGDMATEVPENENWDSFRSFAKLQIRTRGTVEGWGREDRG